MNNKGFTLVELLVAMLVGTFVMFGIITVVQLGFNSYKYSDVQSKLQIESQVMSQNLKDNVKSCVSYGWIEKSGYNILEIKTYNRDIGNYVYINYYIKDNKCFYRVTSKSYSSDETVLNINDFELLSSLCSDISLTPLTFDSYDAETNNISVDLSFKSDEEVYNTSFIVHNKSSN